MSKNTITLNSPEGYDLEPFNIELGAGPDEAVGITLGGTKLSLDVRSLFSSIFKTQESIYLRHRDASTKHSMKWDRPNRYAVICVLQNEDIKDVFAALCDAIGAAAGASINAFVQVRSAGAGKTDKSQKIKFSSIYECSAETTRREHTMTVARSQIFEHDGKLWAPVWMLQQKAADIWQEAIAKKCEKHRRMSIFDASQNSM